MPMSRIPNGRVPGVSAKRRPRSLIAKRYHGVIERNPMYAVCQLDRWCVPVGASFAPSLTKQPSPRLTKFEAEAPS